MVVHGTAQVDELQRRVAALMRIQQEMRSQTLIKELDPNYVTPPPSAPLGDQHQMPHMQPPQPTSISTHHTQNIPSQVSPLALEHAMMRRPGSPLGVNVNVPNSHTLPSTQPKCDFASPQPAHIDNPFLQQSQQQSQFGQLNINQLLSQQAQQQTTQQPNGQTSLLPLIQKFLSGELGRDDKSSPGAENQAAQQRTQQQPTGTSLALNQLIGNNSSPSTQQPITQQLSPLVQPNQPASTNTTDPMLYPGLHANLLNAFASSMAPTAAQANYLQSQQQQLAAGQLQQPANMLDFLQQALLRQQQQNNILSLLQQNREQIAKLAGVSAPTQIPSDYLVAPQPTLNEKVANFVNPATNPTLLSPPLSSNSPFTSSEKSPTPIDVFAAPPTEKSVTPTAHVFATPPATLKSKEKPVKKTKKQLKMEAAAQNGTPISGRKRQTNGKRETKAEKRARTALDKPTKMVFAPRELTENENIALEVLTGLANGRFQ